MILDDLSDDDFDFDAVDAAVSAARGSGTSNAKTAKPMPVLDDLDDSDLDELDDLDDFDFSGLTKASQGVNNGGGNSCTNLQGASGPGTGETTGSRGSSYGGNGTSATGGPGGSGTREGPGTATITARNAPNRLSSLSAPRGASSASSSTSSHTPYGDIDNTPLEYPKPLEATHHELSTPDLSGSFIYPSNMPYREYQYEIIRNALVHNLLCALPTGLGKTFIASVVMLNYFRWYKNAKIIFMAPTKPLVSQQIDACLGITGLPRSECCVLIGSGVKQRDRELEWQSKRVFFATPQIVELDLHAEILDPRDIVLLVVDEAHHTTGKYAYGTVIQRILESHQAFRVLGLTATPASKVEGVQGVVKNLLVSRLEVRSEESKEIKKYMHDREVVKIHVEPGPDIQRILKAVGEILAPTLRSLSEAGILANTDVSKITLFGIKTSLERHVKRMRMANASPALQFKYRGTGAVLASVAHATQLLQHQGITQFYDTLRRKDDEEQARKEMTKSYSQVCGDLHSVFTLTKQIMEKDGYLAHPKLVYLKQELEAFFRTKKQATAAMTISDSSVSGLRTTSKSDNAKLKTDENGNLSLSKPSNAPKPIVRSCIIFAKYRSTINVIMDHLAGVEGVKPHIFIGQAPTKEDKEKAGKGMTQKQQQNVIKRFRAGEINTLVATSIAEEGLDIGQVDLIVCYDSNASPISSLQRMGRTGRARDGKVVMLMTEKEADNSIKSQDNYLYIQRLMEDGSRVPLYPPNRIIPGDGTTPPPVFMQNIDLPSENVELLAQQKATDGELADLVANGDKKMRVKLRKDKDGHWILPKKRKKVFRVPEGAELGFISAGALSGPSQVSDTAEASKKSIEISDLSVDLSGFTQASDDKSLELPAPPAPAPPVHKAGLKRTKRVSPGLADTQPDTNKRLRAMPSHDVDMGGLGGFVRASLLTSSVEESAERKPASARASHHLDNFEADLDAVLNQVDDVTPEFSEAEELATDGIELDQEQEADLTLEELCDDDFDNELDLVLSRRAEPTDAASPMKKPPITIDISDDDFDDTPPIQVTEKVHQTASSSYDDDFFDRLDEALGKATT